MKKFSLKYLTITVVALTFFLTGCSWPWAKQNIERTTPPLNQQNENTAPIGLANPASQYCLTSGGTLQIKESKQGQYGVCYFEDNRQCEEWALLRGDCPIGGKKITGYENDAEIYCAITGGTVEGVGTDTPMCKRIDGTLCTAQANYDGECPDPTDPEPNAGNVEVK